MTQESESIGDRLERLIEVGRELIEEIRGFTEDSGEQFVSLARRGQINRRMIWALVVSFALTLALVAGFGLALKRVDDNNDRIDSLTRRLDVAQTDTRAKVLCPLYELLLASVTPQARAASGDPEAYDHTVKVIQDGYDALHCDEIAQAPSKG